MADAATEIKTEEKTEEKTETKMEAPSENVKTESKTEEKTEEKTEKSEEEPKTEKTEAKSEEKSEDKTEGNGDVKEEEKTEAKKEETEAKKEEAADETKKEEPKETSEASDLEQRIIKQMEYYFGDVNLGRDKFLQGQIKEDNGWVKMEVLLTFNRLHSLSEDAAVIVAAVEKSDSGLIHVHEDKTKVRRNPDKPLPACDKHRRDDLKNRTCYVKGFPLDMTLEKAEEFFGTYGGSEHIQLRRDIERKFKGSVFVLFKTQEQAKKFLEVESMKVGEEELMRLSKDDYFKMKAEQKKSVKEDQLMEEEDKKKDKEDEDKESFRNRITKGSVVQLQGLPDGLTIEELRETFTKFGEVAWVEYQRGDPNARVRFTNQDEGHEALKKAKEGGELKIKDKEVQAHVLGGDEEIDFWKSLFQGQRDRKNKSRLGKRGRGGRGYGRGPPNKRRRVH